MTPEDLLAGLPPIPNVAEQPGSQPLYGDDLLKNLPPQPDQSQTESVPKTSVSGAVLRAAAENIGPGAAAAAAFAPGAKAGATIGAMIPGLGETGIGEAGGALIGGAVTSAIAAGTAAWAQHKAAQIIAPEATQKLDTEDAADASQHPVAGAIGRIAASLPMFELSPLQSVQGVSALFKAARGVALTAADKSAATAMAAQVGLGTGQAVVQPLLFGDSPTKQGIAEAFVQSLLLGKPRFDVFGAHAAKEITNEESEKDDQQETQRNDVENPAANYTPPAATDLTPEQRGELSDLAARVAAGHPMSAEDVIAHTKMTADSDEARQYFNDQKKGWAQIFTHNIALKIPDIGAATAETPEESPSPVDNFIAANPPPAPVTTEPVAPPATATPAPQIESPAPISDQLQQARKDVDVNPTDAQKAAGNYSKGSVTIDGMNISIENPKGGVRSGTDSTGKSWSVDMPADYGYIKGTTGKDGDHADVFIGPNPDGFQKVWVVDQNKRDGTFDENKSLVGFDSKEQALDAYRKSYATVKADDQIRGVTELSRDQFKQWVEKGNFNKPLSESKLPAPAWMAHAGDPEKFTDQFRDVAESGKVNVAKTGERAAIYTSLAGAAPEQAKADIYQDRTANKNSGAESRKLVALQSPDGSHVVVGTASETVNNGKRVAKVSTYNLGKDIGRKSPGGEHYVSDYDKMVAAGWKPLASLKTDKALRGHFQTYSSEQWRGIESQLQEIKSAAQRTTEAVASHIEAGGFKGGEGVRGDEHPTGDEHVPGDVESERAAATGGTTTDAAPVEERVFTPEHAQDIIDALKGVKPDKIRDIAGFVGQLKKSGPDAIEGYKVLVRQVLDSSKMTPDEATQYARNLIYEHQSGNNAKSAESLVKSSGTGSNQEGRAGSGDSAGSSAGVPSADTESGRASAVAEPGGGGTPAAAEANPKGADESTASQPDANAGRDNAVNAPRVEVADKDGLGPKDYGKLQAIAERVASEHGHDGREAIEAAADDLLEHGIALKVDDKPALLVGNTIHTFDGKEFPLTPELLSEVGKFRRVQASKDIAQLRPTFTKTADAARTVERNLRAIGIRVDRVVDVLAKHFSGGEYKELVNGKGNAHRIITWTVADANKPTPDSLISLFHEAFHAVFARETPEIQAMAQRAVRNVSNEALGIGDFEERVAANVPAGKAEGVRQEGRIAEALARNLVKEGFDPARASSFVQRVTRLIRDMYHGTLMALARAAGYPVSQERSMAYLSNRLKMVSAGDSISWLNYLGGARMKMPDWDNPNTSLTRNRGINPTSNPRLYLESKESAPVGIAALNHFISSALEQVRQWDIIGNTAGLTDAQIVAQFIKLPEKVGDANMFTDGATPSSLIADAIKIHKLDPAVAATKIDDLPNEVAKQRAAAVAHATESAWQAKMRGVADEARSAVKEQTHELQQNNDRLTRITKNYVDIDQMADTSRKAMIGLVDDSLTAVRGIRDFAAQDGELGQVLRQLDTTIQKGDLPQPYKLALDEIHQQLTDSDGEQRTKFSDSLQHIAALDIDWKNIPTNTLKEGLREIFNHGNHEYLRPFFSDTPKSRALLATIISFGKSNSHMMDLLALRADKASTARAEANVMLKDMLTVNRDGMRSLRDRIVQTFGKDMKLRDRMLRLADQFNHLKGRNNDLMTSIADNKAMDSFHKDVFEPIMAKNMAELEKMTGIQLRNFEVFHGAKVSVPTDAASKPAQFSDRTLSLKSDIGKKGERPTPTPDVTGWMKSLQAWVDNKANERFGAKYNEAQDTLLKLKNHYVTDEYLNLKGDLANRVLAPLQEKCNQAGTPAARLSGQAFNRYSSLVRSKIREVVQHGTKFATELNDARAACGYPAASEKTFWTNVIAPALHDLEQNGDKIWANAKSVPEMVTLAVQHALNFMDLKQTPKAIAPVEKLLRQHVFNSDLMVKNGAEVGNKVLDQSGSYKIYRNVLGKAPFTLPRAITDIAQDFFREHMSAWGGDSLKADAIAKQYESDPQALRDSLKERFSPPVWQWFMRSLANNDKAHFYAPENGGVMPMASRDNIIKAFENSSDPVTFAEHLATLEGRKADGAFVGETLDTVQNFANLLRTMVGDSAETVRGGGGSPNRFIVDARHIEAAPSEWMDYLMSDQYTMEKIIHGQSFQAAFGRNGTAMDHNLGAAIAEQRQLVDRNSAWRSAIQSENPGLSEKQLQQMIKDRAQLEGVSYTRLKEAQNNLNSLNSVGQHYDAIKGMNSSGIIPEMKPFARLMQAIGAGTVSGVGTAITAHSVFLEQPTRLFGLTPRALAMTARSTVDLAKVMANSMLQTFGQECHFEAERMLAANDAGLFDPINTNRQRLVSAYNHAYAAYKQAGRVGQAVGRVADVGQAAMQSDVFAPGARDKALARQAEGKPIAPTLKALSPFHWMAECLQISNFITWQRHIEGMVANGVKHFELNPAALDDKNFRFTREQLSGFGAGDREYRFLTQRMADFGFSPEQMAREAYRNRGTDSPILSPEVNKAVQQLTLNEITLESSLTSRAPFLQTSGLGVAMNPFLGWPLQKTYQVMRALREPNGEATIKALRTGLTAYMAILPIGMGVAWLRNKFDEDVLGRKQNISDLSQIHDFKSGVMTALDNASRVGTFGFLGEAANMSLNDDNVRPLSLDSRIFFVNTIENAFNAARSLYGTTAPMIADGNVEGAARAATDYQTVLRPLAQDFGGNGMLQNLGAINHLLSLDDAEARASNRISVNNYLRVAGREMNLDVRNYAGMLNNASAPTPIKPFIGQMVLAAYANDHEAFNDARRLAIKEARAEGMTPEEAAKKVVTAYEGQNPLRIVFRTPPTEYEFRKLIAQLPDNGKQSVQQAMQLYQNYGSQIGANSNVFGRDKSEPRASSRTTAGGLSFLNNNDAVNSVFQRLRSGAGAM